MTFGLNATKTQIAKLKFLLTNQLHCRGTMDGKHWGNQSLCILIRLQNEFSILFLKRILLIQKFYITLFTLLKTYF